MPQGGLSYATDEQLQELLNDPRFKPEHESLLTPDEQQRLEKFRRQAKLGVIGKTAEGAVGLAKGAAKGVGNTVLDVAELANKIPGVDKLPQMFDSQAAIAKGREATAPSGGAEDLGMLLEQMGEFVTPAGAARSLGMKAAIKSLPKQAARSLTNKQRAASVGRVAGEAGSAGAVSGLHGDESPEAQMAIAGGGTAAGEAGGIATKALLQSPLGRKLIPILVASGMMSAAGTVGGPGGLGAAMGLFGLAKSGAQKQIRKPGVPGAMAEVVRRTGQHGGRAAASAVDIRRRRAESDLPSRSRGR